MRANIRKQLGYLLKRSVSRSERFSYFRQTIYHFYRLNRSEDFSIGSVSHYLSPSGNTILTYDLSYILFNKKIIYYFYDLLNMI